MRKGAFKYRNSLIKRLHIRLQSVSSTVLGLGMRLPWDLKTAAVLALI